MRLHLRLLFSAGGGPFRIGKTCMGQGIFGRAYSTRMAEAANAVPGAGDGPTEVMLHNLDVESVIGILTSVGMMQFATFAGGCFWGLEKWFRKEFGTNLKTTSVGYVGGEAASANYRAVCSGTTGHAEALQLEFFPEKTAYPELLDFFFRIHDPTTLNRQGNDVGTQYRSAIFVHSPQQKEQAAAAMERAEEKWKQKLVTQVVEVKPSEFVRAEDDHQLYLEVNPGGYCNHRPRY
eukprot:GDKH01015587.1.p1 GENE.GDKH01015587.1~~GDKH01015587.1.p1  ORF type:complete len:235 (-),score=40.93 GDKH01015587.1:110-814(-)